MWKSLLIVPAAFCGALWLSQADAQPPARKTEEPARDKPRDLSASPIFTRMMSFDANKDGKLTKDEISDPRMMRLFEMADANKDGVVTKEELLALVAKLEADGGERGPGDRGPGDRGPGDRGPGDRGPGGPGGMGRFGPPQPGVILAPMMQDRLQLTEQQKKQLADLQKDVDGKLDKILTAEQKDQLKRMREGPPGGPGGPGRPGEGRPGEGRPGEGRPGEGRPAPRPDGDR